MFLRPVILILIFFAFVINPLFLLSANKNSTKTQPAQKKNNQLSGYVFYDYDKNGIKDSGDFGLGGIYVLYNSSTLKTTPNGFFNFKTEKPINFLTEEHTVEIDEDSIKGLQPTTPVKTIIKDQKDLNFGLFYESETVKFFPENAKRARVSTKFESKEFEIRGNLNSAYFEINDSKIYIPELTVSPMNAISIEEAPGAFKGEFSIETKNLDEVLYWQITIKDSSEKVLYEEKKEGKIEDSYSFSTNKFLNVNYKKLDFVIVRVAALTKASDFVTSNYLMIERPGKSINREEFNSELFKSEAFYDNYEFSTKFSKLENVFKKSTGYKILISHELKYSNNIAEKRVIKEKLERIKAYLQSRLNAFSPVVELEIRPKRLADELMPKVFIELTTRGKLGKNIVNIESVVINKQIVKVHDKLFFYIIPDQARQVLMELSSSNGRICKMTLPLVNYYKKDKRIVYLPITSAGDAGNTYEVVYPLKGKFSNKISKFYVDGESIVLGEDGRFEVPLKIKLAENKFKITIVDSRGVVYNMIQVLTASLDESSQIYLNLIVPKGLDFVTRKEIFIKGYTNKENKVSFEGKTLKLYEDGGFGFLVDVNEKKKFKISLKTPLDDKAKVFDVNLLNYSKIKGL